MGTQVECQTYSSGSFSVRDLNKDAGTTWSQCYEDQVLDEHQYKGFVQRALGGYSKYDKEKLKKIMLQHEAIFKKQVYELHRLYRIQKDLMYEFQKKGLHKYFVQAEVSQSHSFSSQMPSEDTKTKWQIPHLPVVSNSCNTTPIAGTDDKRTPLNFFKESSMQSSQFCFENGTLQRDGTIQESNLGRFPRRMFDLQLSADVYINSEDGVTEGREDLSESSSRYAIPTTRVYSADPLNGIQLTLGTGEHQENSCKPESLFKNGLRGDTLLADLNKPTQQMFHDILAGSTSIHSHSSRTIHETRPNQLPVVSNTSFLGLQNALSKPRQNDESSRSNLSYAALEERRQEWLTYSEAEESGTGDSFYSSDFHNVKLPISSEPIQLKPTKSHEIILPSKVDTWLGQKPSPGTDIFGRAPCLAILNKSGPLAPGTPSLFSVVPNNLDYTHTTPVVSALTKPMKTISNMVLPLPCFSGSVEANVQSKRPRTMACDTWQQNGDLRPHLRPGTEVPSYGNFRFDSNSAPFSKLNLNNKGDNLASWNDDYEPQKYLSLQCAYIKSATDMYLKKELPNRNQDGPTNQQDERVSTLKGKPTCNEFVHLNKCASQMEYGFSQGYPKLTPSSNGVDLEWDWRQEKKKGPFFCNSQEFPSASQVERRMWRNEVPDSSICKKILGFPVRDKINQSAECLPSHQEHTIADDKDREKNGAGYIEFPSDTEAPSLEKQVHVGDVVLKGQRSNNLINLNSTYNPYSTEMSPEGEIVFLSRFTTVAAKIVSGIDLENTLPQEEFVPSSKMDGSHDTECSREALVREAAENIIHMSSDKQSSVNGITCGQFPPDTLKWFADVVLSKDVLATILAGGDGCSKFPDDGLDDFELMTLKLEETKVNEYWSRPQEPENQKEGEKGASASLLLTRPRRRQGRVRRQRKDFQKDILPGLASLSRHEVEEDLQTIEGLMISSGIPWQTGLTRRNTGRNGLHSNGRGRRRPRSSAVTVPEIRVSPPPVQPTNVQLEIQGLPVLGWGKTTRRCRRQICSPVNVSAPLA